MLKILPSDIKKAAQTASLIEATHCIASNLKNAHQTDVDAAIQHALANLDTGSSIGGAICAGIKAARILIADRIQPKTFKRRHKWPCAYKPSTKRTHKRGYNRAKLNPIIFI